jgi:hypothetical protein
VNTPREPAAGGDPSATTVPLGAPGQGLPWSPAWAWALGILLVAATFLVFMEPLRDGDIYWQMSYGKQLLENRTLIPDQSIYSWTPASNDTIICAWLPEIALYLLYRAGGAALLVLALYACLAVFLAAAWKHARRLGLAGHPLAWLLCLLAVLFSQPSVYVRPQLASFLLMTLMVAVVFRARSGGDASRRWWYLLPALVLVWVNSHGAFVFGLIYLAALGAGEVLNILFNPRAALPPRARRHFFASLALGLPAVLATPYGWRYPAHLLGNVLSPALAGEYEAIGEWDTIFNPRQRALHLIDFWVLALVVMVVLLAAARRRGRGINWAHLPANLIFAVIYARFLRATFLWAPLFLFTSLDLLADGPARLLRPWGKREARLLGGVIAAAMLALAGRAVYDRAVHPMLCSWFGFGTSYFNPVEEAEFIDKNFAGRRLGNDYNSGGYLMWRLWPGTRVFIDQRYFPYRGWYGDYRRIVSLDGIDNVLKKYPADLWCLTFPLEMSMDWFWISPDWVPVFYGASAAVFARGELAGPGARVVAGKGVDDIRNLVQARRVLKFALKIGDTAGAARIAAGIGKRFTLPGERGRTGSVRSLAQGLAAWQRRDYEGAVEHLAGAREDFRGDVGPLLAASHLLLAGLRWRNGDPRSALREARAAVEEMPEDPRALYDAGAIGWYLERRSGTGSLLTGWREDLGKFLRISRGGTGLAPGVVEAAGEMLAGSFDKTPPLLMPAGPENTP